MPAYTTEGRSLIESRGSAVAVHSRHEHIEGIVNRSRKMRYSVMTMESLKTDAVQIREVIDECSKAVRDKDWDALMKHYADDCVTFDIMPPLEYRGADNYHKNIERCLDIFEKPMQLDVSDLNINVSGDVAFAHSLNHFVGQLIDKPETYDNWMRVTTCFRNIDGAWKITHEHTSVPVDEQTGLGRMDLKP